MRSSPKRRLRLVLHLTFFTMAAISLVPTDSWAQGETTSAILGQVTDSTNAAVPGAAVTVIDRDTGLKRSAKTDDAGRFNFPQLKPGSYTVRVEAQGFEPKQADNVVSGLGQKQTVNFTLRVAQSKQTVEVTSEAPIINTSNANTSTTLNAPALENLPNAGGDMTYPLQFAPGALINTAGNGNDFVGGTNGYGNVEFNGLPALSNGYIVDGLETNDPLTNLNSGLSTNLVLGLNSVSEVTINTLSYSVDQGRYGASQVNYVTKSGTNQFHGNLYELWNGGILNAADYFTNATSGNRKPGSTVNHLGGSLGGPIIHDKLFFFFDSEWVRIALPIFTTVTVPSAAFQQYVLQQLPLGGTDSVTGSHYAPAPQMVPFYQKMFALYGNTSGTPLAVLGCPFNSDGGQLQAVPRTGTAARIGEAFRTPATTMNRCRRPASTTISVPNDTAWFRFQADTGLQAAYTDPINPLFNAISPQPLYSFAAGYTHVFSQNLVNYFNPAFSWYESLFGPSDFQKTLAAFPIVLQGSGANAPFTTIGGLDNTWVQGRRASRFFINDNLAWSHGAHELRFGTNTRIFRLNDYDFGQGTVPTVAYTTLPQFIYGVASTATKTFPSSANEPFNFLNLDFYAQDTWRVTPTLTWTFGVRDTYNSNPLNPHDQVARLKGSFYSISHDVNEPLSDAIQTGLGHVFASDSAGDSATQDRHRVAVRTQHNIADRIWSFQRYLAGKCRRPDRSESALRADLPGRFARNRRRHGNCARSAQQRGRRNDRGESAVQLRFRAGPAFLRLAACKSGNLPSSGCNHGGSGWQASRAVLHAVEFRNRAPIRKYRQRSGAVCGHPRGESALPDAGQWIPNRMPGMLYSIPLHAANRSEVRGGNTAFHGCQQQL